VTSKYSCLRNHLATLPMVTVT